MKQRLIFIFASLFLFVGMAMAQTTASGVVVSDEDGEPIVGATVKVVGTANGTITDLDGKFSVSAPSKTSQLEVSYIGMTTEKVNIGTNLRIVLRNENSLLDEVMVVAYGTQKRSSFTGSAAEVKAEKIEGHVASNVTNALAGTTAGVQFTSSNGDPASNGASIRIRGFGSMSASNSPLYIVDGMPYEGAISNLNPQDIESMTVLKDAAASAIYGARGANGVIIITTKKGKNRDAEVKFDARWGSNSRAIPQYDVVSDPGEYYAVHFRRMYNAQIIAGATPEAAYASANANLYNQNNGGLGYQVFTLPAGQNLIGTNFKVNPNAVLGYSDGQYFYTPDDWYAETYHNSFRQEYNASASGSTERLNYYASASYLNDGGIVNNSDYQRYTARTNLDFQAKSWLKLDASMGFTHTDSNQPSYSTTTWGSSGNLFYIVNNMAPIYPLYVRDAQGNIMKDNGRIIYDSNQTNQVRPSVVGNAVRDNEYNSTKTYRDMFNGNWGAVITPLEGLTLTAKIGVTSDNRRSNSLDSAFGSASSMDGIASVTSIRQLSVNNQYLANYSTDFNGKDIHHFDILAGYEQYRYKYQYFYGYNDHLYDPTVGELGNAGGNGDSKYLNSYTDDYMTEGFLSRAQYDYKERYFISGSFRRDASSRFAPGHRWGNFYSVGGAWQISKENWFKVKAIDYLKLKASYGEQGNDDLSNANSNMFYAYADMYNTSYNAESGEYSITLTQKGNPDLTWEKSKNFNIGVDFGMFKGRINGTLEFYNRATSDLLYNKPTPLSAGIVTGYYPMNVGSIINRGVEFNIDAQIIKNKHFNWDVNLNITSNHNEITSLDPSVAENGIKRSYYIYSIGGSLYQAYMAKFAGVCQQSDIDASDGKFTSADLGRAMYWQHKTKTDDKGNVTEWDEKTCTFSDATKYDVGSTLPKVYGGFGTSFKLYDFDFSAQFQYQLGGKFYDSQYQTLMWTQDNRGSNIHKDALNAWTPENTNTNIPRLDTEYAVSQSNVDCYLTSSNYLSLNNVTLGYTMPRRLVQKLDLGGLRLYVAGENLFVLTARKGMDPRYSMGIGGYTSGTGMASGNYSALRTITAGISLTLGSGKVRKTKAQPEIRYVEKVVEKIVEKPVVKEVEKPVVKEVVKEVATASNMAVVCFAVNSAELTAEAKAELDKIVGSADVVAYASPEGDAEMNKELSKARAKAVADYLASKGVKVNSYRGEGAPNSASNRIAIVVGK